MHHRPPPSAGALDARLVSVEVSSPTQVPLCNLDGTELSTGHEISGCALTGAARERADLLRRALAGARVRSRQSLEESCGFTHVTAWIDTQGRLVAYGVSSVNSEGESPALNDCVEERAAALRVLAPLRRMLGRDAGALTRLVYMLGGCD